jgi:hypothetical protein
MRVRFVTLVFAVCGACLFAIPQPPAPAEPQIAATQIDFDALHAKAISALEKLQQLNERQPSVASALEL